MEVAKSNRTNTAGGAKSLKRVANPLGSSGKNTKKESQQRSFLTTKFNPLPIFDIVPDKVSGFNIEGGERLILGGHEIEIEKNLTYLRECSEAYCKVHGGSVPPKYNHPLRELQMLYSAVAECCPKDNIVEINYDCDEKRLVFIELAPTRYPDLSLAFFSVRFLELLPTEYRQFFLSVLSLARVTLSIPFPEDHFDFAYATGYFDPEYLGEVCEYDPDYMKSVDIYVNGTAHKLFDEILNAPWIEFEKGGNKVNDYVKRLIDNAPSKELERFVEIAADGIELMSGQNIMRFRFNVGQCNIPQFDNIEDDGEAFSFDRVVAFCYGEEDDDPVVERALGCINTESGNYIQEELYDPCMITPEYSTPFKPSDFPQRFFDWYVKFNKAQTEYEQTHKSDVRDIQSQARNNSI